jgi:hypothetical protein
MADTASAQHKCHSYQSHLQKTMIILPQLSKNGSIEVIGYWLLVIGFSKRNTIYS